MPSDAIHRYELKWREWWACDEPERPYDLDVVYEETCARCVLKAEVDRRYIGDDCPMEDCVDPSLICTLADIAYGRVESTR